MNRKGLGFPSIITVFITVLVIMVLAMAQNGVDTSTLDKTINSLNWSKIGANVSSTLDLSINETKSQTGVVILEICKRAIDFMGYAVFEVAKLAMRLAAQNPDIINYKVLLWLLLLSLISPIIYPAFIITVSLFLIIKEWIQVRKEKKAIKNYKTREEYY